MGATDPLVQASTSQIAHWIRDGIVSSREVVESFLRRIETLNTSLNAVTRTLAESALSAADSADEARRVGRSLGPLHGVPFCVKESIDCVGSATTFGVPALRGALPYVDAPVVARLKKAGAIPIARTNLSELGMRLCTDNPLRGRTRNPRDRKLTVGGSSGGDAVAVATGMTPMSLGSDMGGSLRIPAHFCGVAALKPTTGRVAHAASLAPEDMGLAGQLMLATGPLARNVVDLRLILGVIAGRDPRDPRSVDAPLRGPAQERTVALVTRLAGVELSSSTVAAIERAGAILERSGWVVELASPPEVQRVGEIWHKVIADDLRATLPMVEPILSPQLVGHIRRICTSARLEEASPTRVHQERSRLGRAWSRFFSEYSVVIGPTCTRDPWPYDADLDPTTGISLLEMATRFVLPANALGFPSVVVPLPHDDGSLPESVQIQADLWREDLCLEVAERIQEHVGAPPAIS